MVTVICYGKETKYSSAKDALADFLEGMSFCDPGSSEYTRYAFIVGELLSGQTYIDAD